jgi:hypothetical protein
MLTEATSDIVCDIQHSVEVDGKAETVFRGLIDRMTHLSGGPNGQTLPLKLEEWPGGRWYRDLGNKTGHLWGHVQSIKPPVLLEIYGPMMMSFAVASNLIIRLKEANGVTEVSLRHQILGNIPQDYRTGMDTGWVQMLQSIPGARSS